jgi:hypothetical protein
MPASSTAYGIINHSNENIKLTVIPKFERDERQRGITPEKRIEYYKDGKYALTLFIKECRRMEKELLLVYREAKPPYYENVKSGVTILDLATILWIDIQPIEILRYLIDDIIVYDMQDNVILTYGDITENSIDSRGDIIITQEMVDAGRNKHRVETD